MADGSDNFATRFLLNDAMLFCQEDHWFPPPSPNSTASWRLIKAHERTGAYPCYRCLFPEPPPPGTAASCSETGILGAAAGVMGTLQALEVLKEIFGAGRKPGRASC